MQAYLASTPQYAYVAGRALRDAVTRVSSPCASIRKLIQSQASNIHARRDGKVQRSLFGGIQLSLDISKAFDCLPRDDLRQAMAEAHIDPDVSTAIARTHEEA